MAPGVRYLLQCRHEQKPLSVSSQGQQLPEGSRIMKDGLLSRRQHFRSRRRWRPLLRQAFVVGITQRKQSCEILATKGRLVRKARGHLPRILYPVQRQLYPSRDSNTCFVVGGPCSLSWKNALAKGVHKLSDPLSTVRGDKLPGEINGPDPYRTLLVKEFLHVQNR